MGPCMRLNHMKLSFGEVKNGQVSAVSVVQPNIVALA